MNDTNQLDTEPDGCDLIADERLKQIDIYGIDEYTGHELLLAALSYAELLVLPEEMVMPPGEPPDSWPASWDGSAWKPSPDPIRNLVKAGALLAAEIDRLIRAKAKAKASNDD